jgi:hypothetical protein
MKRKHFGIIFNNKNLFPANLFVDDARNFFGDLVADVVRPVDLVGDPPVDDLGDVGLAHRGGLVENVCKQKRRSSQC